MKYSVQSAPLHFGPGFQIVDDATKEQVRGTGFYTLAGQRDAGRLCDQLNAAFLAGAMHQRQLVVTLQPSQRSELSARVEMAVANLADEAEANGKSREWVSAQCDAIFKAFDELDPVQGSGA